MPMYDKKYSFVPLGILIGLFFVGAIYGISDAKYQNDIRPTRETWKQVDGVYKCPKCGSTKLSKLYHTKESPCNCLAKGVQYDHLSLECNECYAKGHDPK